VPAGKLTTVVKVSVENADLFLNDHITSPRSPHQLKKEFDLFKRRLKVIAYLSIEART
jgi:hypothetical protein